MATSRATRSATETHRAVVIALSAIAVLLGLLFSPLARADGDPASDVLLGQNVFYPYLPAVSKSLESALNSEVSAAAHAHFKIKVALIGGPTDLGVVPQLFGKPQTYAHFLDQELRLILGPHVPLLVVMPQGYGTVGLPPAANAAAAGLAKPTGKPNNSLAQGALAAVRKLAAAAGHPIQSTSDASGGGTGSGGGGSVWTMVIIAAACVAAAGAILLTRRRLSRSR